MKQSNQGTLGDEYHQKYLQRILEFGYMDENPRPKYSDGTPAHTLSINFISLSYNIFKKDCPILTLRPIAWKSAIKEILWIYQMQSNKLKDLHDMNIHYWDEWDIGDGTIGQRYGATIKRYNLMNNLLKCLIENPYGRRHIVDMWQYDDLLRSEGLNPCCFMTIWNVRNAYGMKFLDMQLIQRSSDFTVSVSINEIQYVALQMMVARHCGYEVGVFSHVISNAQIYDRHIDNAKELISRTPLVIDNGIYLKLKEGKTNFYDFTIDDFEMVGYDVDRIKGVNPQLTFDLGI